VNFELDSDLLAVRAEARQLADSVSDFAVQADASSDLDARMLQLFRESNLAALMVPQEFGGRFEVVDPLAICVVREELAPMSAQLDSLFAMQGLGSYAITTAGSDAQKNEWLPRVGSADALAAVAISELGAGSDVQGIVTRLTESNDGLRLNGTKSFISNGGIAAFYTVLVREDRGLSLVLLPSGVDGLSVTASPELMSAHVLGELTFRDVPVGLTDRIGEPGRGLDLVLAALSVFRASVGAAAVGLAQRAFDVALEHTSTRHQFGKPLAEQGAIGAILADSWGEIEMARWFVYRAAWLARTNPRSALAETSMAKVAATEMACRVIDRCLQAMGRFGLVRYSPLERLYRQARPLRVYEGASEVLRASVARSLVKGRVV
jgi:acyl-CoA dehydrogenase